MVERMDRSIISCCGILLVLLCVSTASGHLSTNSASYYGCYSTDLVSEYLATGYLLNTIEACVADCRNKSHLLAGIRDSTCYCSTDRFADLYTQAESFECYDGNAIRCSGNKQQICGGQNAISVYAVCDPGYGGEQCDLRCADSCGLNKLCSVTEKFTYGCTGLCHSGWTNVDNRCITPCNPQQYGPRCHRVCAERCANDACNPINGSCTTGCTSGKGPHCLETCLTGTFGSNCQYECLYNNNCAQNCYADGVCSGRCKTGWTGRKCDECSGNYFGSSCETACSADCANRLCNSKNGKCYYCTDKKYGDYCNISCPAGCAGACDQSTGKCDACKSNLYMYGDLCNEPCPNNCNGQCIRSTGKCNGCRNNKYGDSCKSDCPDNCDCSVQCVNPACEQSTGNCNGDCKEGFYGPKCTRQCGKYCNGGCEKGTGDCKCKPGYYGKKCETPCPGKCAKECDKDTGNCIDGCKDKTFTGAQCDVSCPCGDKCDDDGNCPPTTTTTVTPGGVSGPSKTGSGRGGNNEAVIGGAVGGVLFIIIIAVVVVLLVVWYRRRRQPKLQEADAHGSEMGDVVGPPPNPHIEDKEDEIPDPEPAVIHETPYYIKPTKVDLSLFALKVDTITSHINRVEQLGGFKGEFEKIPKGRLAECTVAQQKHLKDKNKYKNNYPYDHNRVVLQADNIQDGFVNASHVTGYNQTRNYIATQGPTNKSVYDFLYMLIEKKIQVIVMTTNLYESGKEKCWQYWPDEDAEHDMVQQDICVALVEEKRSLNYTMRKLHVTKQGESTHEVTQFHYTGWPDHGAPDSTVPLLSMREMVLQHASDPAIPILVHCSAGIGRTGTFIALDMLLEQSAVEDSINIPATVHQLRKERVGLIQTHHQYGFLYRALSNGINLGALNISSQSALRKQYQALDDMRPTFKEEDFKVAKRNINKEKNRNMNILPASKHRVMLMNFPKGRTDYINANYVDTYLHHSALIVTQLPLADTVTDFWTMIMDYKCSAIVFIQPQQQQDVQWLPTRDARVTLPSYEVCLSAKGDIVHIVEPAQYSNMEATTDDGDQYMNHAEVGGVPSLHSCILHQISSLDSATITNGYNRIKDWMAKDSPAVIVCLDGCGESGVFVGVCVVREMQQVMESVNIAEAVTIIRATRPQFITNVDQFLSLAEM